MIVLQAPQQTPMDLHFKILDVPVRVHPGFWIVTILFAMGAGSAAFVAAFVGCMFLSILLHECGHAFAHRYYGDRHPSIVLYHFGGLCLSDQSLKRWPRVSMLLWGPGAGFILGGIALAIHLLIRYRYMAPPSFLFQNVLIQLMWINFFWGLVNLLPIFPLDGGQITQEAIEWKLDRPSDLLTFTISFYTALLAASVALIYAIINFQREGADAGMRVLWPVILFASLAYSNHAGRRQVQQYGEFDQQESRRQPWEQDPDWWKKS